MKYLTKNEIKGVVGGWVVYEISPRSNLSDTSRLFEHSNQVPEEEIKALLKLIYPDMKKMQAENKERFYIVKKEVPVV